MNSAKVQTVKRFNSLFMEYYESLVRFSFNIVQDLEVSKDLVSDVFAKIWPHIDDIEEESIKNYLYLSVKNHSIDWLRRKSMADEYYEEYLKTYEELTSDEKAEDERKEAVLEIVKALPQQTQQILNAFYIEGLKQVEIAEQMGLSVATIKKYLMYARTEIRKQLKDDINV